MEIEGTRNFSISETPTPEEMEHICEAVENHKRIQTGGNTTCRELISSWC